MATLNPQLPPTACIHGTDAADIRRMIENDAWEIETTISHKRFSTSLRRYQEDAAPGMSASIGISDLDDERLFEWAVYLAGEAFPVSHWRAGAGECTTILAAMEAGIEAKRLLLSGNAPFYLYERSKPFDRAEAMLCLSRAEAGRTMLALTGKPFGEGYDFDGSTEEKTFWYLAQDGARKTISKPVYDYKNAYAAVSEVKDLELACISLAEADDMEGVTFSPPAAASVLADMADDETRSAIGQAHDEAVRAAIENAA